MMLGQREIAVDHQLIPRHRELARQPRPRAPRTRAAGRAEQGEEHGEDGETRLHAVCFRLTRALVPGGRYFLVASGGMFSQTSGGMLSQRAALSEHDTPASMSTRGYVA